MGKGNGVRQITDQGDGVRQITDQGDGVIMGAEKSDCRLNSVSAKTFFSLEAMQHITFDNSYVYFNSSNCIFTQEKTFFA